MFIPSSCSVPCYKTHKASNTECIKPIHTEDNIIIDRNPTKPVMFTTIDSIPVETLKELSQSDELKTLLYNPHLRNLLREVDSEPQAWNAMKAAMMEPLFIEFADACLKVVQPSPEDYPD
jgi:zinc finger HIT domain-containing protein 3